MQYRLATEGHTIEFRIPDLLKKSGWRIAKASFPPTAHIDDVLLLCNCTVKISDGAAIETQTGNVAALQRKFNFLASWDNRLPNTEYEWKSFCLAHLTFHLTDTDHSHASFTSRKGSWPFARSLYKQLRAEGVMPRTVPILTVSMRGSTIGFEDSKSRKVLGEVRQAVSYHDTALPKKYLVDQTYALSSEEYINLIESKLKHSSLAVRDGCYEYWTKMKTAHANGREAIGSISTDEIEKVLASGKFSLANGRCVCDPRSPMGANWFLAVVNYYLLNDPGLTHISFTNLIKRYPIFKDLKTSPEFIRLIGPALRKIADGGNDDRIQSTEILNRLLGLLSIRDCSAAAALLTFENPNFNSLSLQQAKLLDEHGKSFYAISINGTVIFSVEKPRADSRKASSLPSMSQMIMEDLIQATQIVRTKLKNSNDDRYRFLFLVSHRLSMGTTADIDSMMNGSIGLNLYDAIYLGNLASEVTQSTFTLSNIRNTVGIVEFLAKGSLAAMAKKLGNSIEVILDSYIPPWLIEMWCERIIRRFQQKLVIVANAKTPWLLPASDFSSLGQITDFVKSMLTEGRVGDKFTEMIAERFGDKSLRKPSEVMFINLNPESLAALYAYEILLDNQFSQAGMERPDEEQAKLIALARLFRCVAETPAYTSSDFSANLELQGESSAEFKLVHKHACNLANSFVQRYSRAKTYYKG